MIGDHWGGVATSGDLDPSRYADAYVTRLALVGARSACEPYESLNKATAGPRVVCEAHFYK